MRWVRRHYRMLWMLFAVMVILMIIGRVHSRPVIAVMLVWFIVLMIAGNLSPEGTGAPDMICDRCKFNYGDACGRPERPNASQCPDFADR